MSMFKQWCDPKMAENVMKTVQIDAIVGGSEKTTSAHSKFRNCPVVQIDNFEKSKHELNQTTQT